MKLAAYHDGSRDGQLVVVSRDLSLAHYASGVATRLQQVLDDWNFLSPQLEELSQTLNHGKARHAFAFEPVKCMAPLPRAYRWVEAVPATTELSATELAMHERASDDFGGPHASIVWSGAEGAERPAAALDFAAQVAVVTGDVAMGTAPDAAIDGVRLLMLANVVTTRPGGDGVRGILSEATSFAPVAVTPDELLHAWRGGRVHLSLESHRNGQRFALCSHGEGMSFHFGQLIAHLCETRPVRAGCIVGSGRVRNRDTALGFACNADKRAIETIEGGAPQTGCMQLGDTIRIEMKDSDGVSVFGAIVQKVVAPD